MNYFLRRNTRASSSSSDNSSISNSYSSHSSESSNDSNSSQYSDSGSSYTSSESDEEDDNRKKKSKNADFNKFFMVINNVLTIEETIKTVKQISPTKKAANKEEIKKLLAAKVSNNKA